MQREAGGTAPPTQESRYLNQSWIMTGNNSTGGCSTGSENANEKNGGEVTALHDLIAGGVAGSASVIVGRKCSHIFSVGTELPCNNNLIFSLPSLDPFDTIKVRLQTSISSPKNYKIATAPIASFQSLFKGMAAPLSTAAVVNAIIFASYGSFTRLWENLFENCQHNELESHGTVTGEGAVFIERGEHGIHEQMKDWKSNGMDSLFLIDSESRRIEAEQMNQDETSTGSANMLRHQNTLKVFLCGAAAGTVQAFVICPMEHIKCRLQVQSYAIDSLATAPISSTQQTYKGPIDVCTSIVKKYGFFCGLYRGMLVTLWRETPAFGMYFATYDTIKDRVENILQEKDGNHPIPSHAHAWAASALAGGISGAWTWAIIYPFDVIKSQIQTGPLEKHLQKGMWTVASDIVQEHGWKHMFRGLGITLARAFPVNAIIFPVYEFVLLQLGVDD